jgi:hypothetical protein
MARWWGEAGWPVSTPDLQLWTRIRGAVDNRNSAEREVMSSSSVESYRDLQDTARRAVRAGGTAFARTLFRPDDDYRDPNGRRISYEAYLRLHGMLRWSR